jgi:hypothetical protein
METGVGSDLGTGAGIGIWKLDLDWCGSGDRELGLVYHKDIYFGVR